MDEVFGMMAREAVRHNSVELVEGSELREAMFILGIGDVGEARRVRSN